MTTSRRWTWGRIATLGVAAGMMLVLAGDRSAWTAVPGGIDPLEILNLQIRANAIIILDSSGSMGETLGAGDLGGDDPDSKLFKAKKTLKSVIRDNQRKVSFQFGQYEQPGIGTQTSSSCSITNRLCTVDSHCPGGEVCVTAPTMRVPAAGLERFLYTTTSVKSASMTSNQLIVDLRSFVVPANTRVEFTENTTNRSSPFLTVGRYPTALALAAEIQTRMMATLGRVNTYTVTFSDARQFVFTKTGSAGQSFGLRWGSMTALRDEVSPGSGTQTSPTTSPASIFSVAQPNNCGTGGDCDLKRRAATDSGFTEGTTTFYKLYARRFFNGQRLRVRPSGVVCTVTGFAAGIPQTGLGGTGQFTVDTDLDGTPDDYDRPWVELERADAACNLVTGASAQVVKFTFSSVPRGNASDTYFPNVGEWRAWNNPPPSPAPPTPNGQVTCGGFESLVALQPCTNNAQLGLVAPFLDNEIEIDAFTHFPVGYVEGATGSVTTQPAVGGIRAAGFTPIAEGISDVDAVFTGTLWPVVSAFGGGSGPFPKTFLIFLTDGDDTCETPDGEIPGSPVLNADEKALRAAHRAQLLYESIDTANAARTAASSVPTFVIAFAAGAAPGISPDRTNWIAWGGSGMVRNTVDRGGQIGLVWDSVPTTSDRANCLTCRDAFLAENEKDLADALQIAIDQGQTGGTFSDQQSVTEPIFELTFLVPQGSQPEPFDPRNPQTRYDTTLPVLLQSTFDMPDFAGHLRAFRNSGPPAFTSVKEWDAGEKLFDRVVTNGMGVGGQWSFDELRGGPGTTDVTIGASAARIKRRVYTTSRHGVFGATGATVANLIDGLSPGRATLWPPEPAVDPAGAAGNWPAGSLDNPMGVGGGSVPPLAFAALQTRFGACTSVVPADLHVDCVAPATAAVMLSRAQKEAREIILAHMAGADLVQIGGLAVRRPLDQELLFRPRAWILAESTLAAPAVAGAPAQTPPTLHQAEYTLYRDGPRAADGTARDGLDMGFGLRNPDDDRTSRTDMAPGLDTRATLKPVMSVAYHAANDMLHAFRAGPCRDNSSGSTCQDSTTETGGEELWGFIPYDVLGTMKDRIGSQRRNPHTYVIASAVRLADVFVPGNFSRNIGGASVSGDGVWRTVIYFGRGIGGKFLTALDVTAPGAYTKGSLQTGGPIALWSRGNPDTQDGFPAGPANNTTSGNTDAAAYSDMGETWSVPAIAPVKAADNTTPRRTTGVEFVAYVGSGFGETVGCASGTDPCEGKRFYTLDALTGDVVRSFEVIDRAGATNPFPNALVAGPAAFNPERLKFQTGASEVNPALDLTTRVYFVDIHGRVHVVIEPTAAQPLRVEKVLADVNDSAATVLHPLGVGPALLNYADPAGGLKPHIFVESGHDNRIFPPDADPATTPPFKLFGLRDDNMTTDPDGSDGVAGPVKVLFIRDLPNLYRGNVQPATAFAASGAGRVFFAGSRFNPPGTIFAPPPPPCRSSFDSILFALGANTGNAAYDLNAAGQDEYIEYQSQKVQAVQVKGGILVVDRGLGAEVPPPPPAPPEVLVPPTSGSVYQGLSIPPMFRVSNRSVPFQMGSAVCR